MGVRWRGREREFGEIEMRCEGVERKRGWLERERER